MTLCLADLVSGTGALAVRLSPDGEVREGGLAAADLQQEVAEVVIDSRLVGSRSVFVALPGQQVDGHDFVPASLTAGALGAVLSRLPDQRTLAQAVKTDQRTRCARYLLVVDDPLVALQRLASYWRGRHSTTVVGITGSVGKTTAKEILASLLGTRWPVLRSQANLNTEIGLPLTLTQLRFEHRAAILEMGLHVAGDIALLSDIARPDIGAVVNVAPVHLERMKTVEAIAREKSRLIAALPPTGLAVLNGDDPWTRAMAGASGVAPAVLVGLSGDCDFRAEEVMSHQLDGMSFTIRAEGRRYPVRTRVPGRHTLIAFLTAAAIARQIGMSWTEIQKAVEIVRLDLRQRILRPADDLTIIDDSYNASPLSMQAALDMLQTSAGSTIAVLGDMLELGSLEECAHRELGEQASSVVDWLIVRGPRSELVAEAAERRGLPRNRIIRAGSNSDAVQAVQTILSGPPVLAGSAHTMQRPGKDQSGEKRVTWTVLIKGSRGMRMEEVVQGLRGDR